VLPCRLVAAGADFGLNLLTKTADAQEYVFPFGGGLSGHHGKVNDMVFCGGWDEDGARYVATVSGAHLVFLRVFRYANSASSDDKTLMVWDLHPPTTGQAPRSPSPAPNLSISPTPSERPQPTAYAIHFPNPLVSIRAHPSTSKEFLVADIHGSVFLTDWRADPLDNDGGALRHLSMVELIEPTALGAAVMGDTKTWSASVDWRGDAIDMCVYYYY
jgi:hypothetical protein